MSIGKSRGCSGIRNTRVESGNRMSKCLVITRTESRKRER